MTRTEILRQRLAEVGPHGVPNMAVALWRREALHYLHGWTHSESVRENVARWRSLDVE